MELNELSLVLSLGYWKVECLERYRRLPGNHFGILLDVEVELLDLDFGGASKGVSVGR